MERQNNQLCVQLPRKNHCRGEYQCHLLVVFIAEVVPQKSKAAAVIICVENQEEMTIIAFAAPAQQSLVFWGGKGILSVQSTGTHF